MQLLITGGTGFIGSTLVENLILDGHQLIVLTRFPQKQPTKNHVQYIENLSDIADNTVLDGIINLAGAPINKRWTSTYKQQLVDSRVQTTKALNDLVKRLDTPPKVFINGSAIGYYGNSGSEIVDESFVPNQVTQSQDFAHQLCQAWENAAIAIEPAVENHYIIRLGVVLGKNGGALAQMLPAFRFGMGGRIGTGKQYFSWVHLTDVINAIEFLLTERPQSGVYNLTAPESVTNAEFSHRLASTLHRPSFMTMPALAIRCLFGEMGQTLLLQGQRVYPSQLERVGFQFTHPQLQGALDDVLSA